MVKFLVKKALHIYINVFQYLKTEKFLNTQYFDTRRNIAVSKYMYMNDMPICFNKT